MLSKCSHFLYHCVINTSCSYLPEVIDKNCKESKACFLPNVSRSHLLLDKVFYFLTEKQVRDVEDK